MLHEIRLAHIVTDRAVKNIPWTQKQIPFNSETVSASRVFKKYHRFGTEFCTSEKFTVVI